MLDNHDKPHYLVGLNGINSFGSNNFQGVPQHPWSFSVWAKRWGYLKCNWWWVCWCLDTLCQVPGMWQYKAHVIKIIIIMSPLCLTQFAVLGGMDWRVRGTLINIADWKDTPSDEGRHLLITEAGMNINPFNFGSPHTRTTFNSYILQLPDASYDIYRPWQWNHLCFAWSSGGKSKIVLVMFMI